MAETANNGPELWAHLLPWPEDGVHKHARGGLGVVTGPVGSTGAARLAARAGLRAGAGMVTLFCPPDALESLSAAVTAPLTVAFRNADDLVARSGHLKAMVVGPAAGVTPATRANVEALAREKRSLVIDADALTVFREEPKTLGALLNAPAVLTPHAGEFERIWPGLRSAFAPEDVVRRAADEANCVVLLKGPETYIGAPDGRVAVNRHATPFLATAGSGDVLAGIIAGLMAQGVEAFDAACAGAWMHGDAGRRAGPGLISEDLDAALKETITELYTGRS